MKPIRGGSALALWPGGSTTGPTMTYRIKKGKLFPNARITESTVSGSEIKYGDHRRRHRLRPQAALAQSADTGPIRAASGNTVRHPLDPGRDRTLNRAINTIAVMTMRTYPTAYNEAQRQHPSPRTRGVFPARYLESATGPTSARNPPPDQAPSEPLGFRAVAVFLGHIRTSSPEVKRHETKDGSPLVRAGGRSSTPPARLRNRGFHHCAALGADPSQPAGSIPALILALNWKLTLHFAPPALIVLPNQK